MELQELKNKIVVMKCAPDSFRDILLVNTVGENIIDFEYVAVRAIQTEAWGEKEKNRTSMIFGTISRDKANV